MSLKTLASAPFTMLSTVFSAVIFVAPFMSFAEAPNAPADEAAVKQPAIHADLPTFEEPVDAEAALKRKEAVEAEIQGLNEIGVQLSAEMRHAIVKARTAQKTAFELRRTAQSGSPEAEALEKEIRAKENEILLLREKLTTMLKTSEPYKAAEAEAAAAMGGVSTLQRQMRDLQARRLKLEAEKDFLVPFLSTNQPPVAVSALPEVLPSPSESPVVVPVDKSKGN